VVVRHQLQTKLAHFVALGFGIAAASFTFRCIDDLLEHLSQSSNHCTVSG
jgi:hypothetical protein